MNSIRLMTGIFNRNFMFFTTKRILIQSRTNANSSANLKFQFDQHSNENHPLTSTTFDNEKIDENFFEQYVSHEFQMSRMETKKIYFLYDDLIRKNYPTNESIVHLCKFLKLFFTAKEIQYNPKPFLLPFQQLYNR